MAHMIVGAGKPEICRRAGRLETHGRADVAVSSPNSIGQQETQA